MTHRFPIKEIALQSGLSTATIDRVLNGRLHVSPQSKRRVLDAIEELVRQEAQLTAKGRRVFIDVVMEAPLRFSREVEKAGQAALTDLSPIALRTRYSVAETMAAGNCAALLDRIRKRGSHGVCLKARDTPETRAAVSRLISRNIPVVTVFTDIGGTARLAYAGLDNERAGKTAAYVILKLLGPSDQTVLTTLSQHAFQGEEARFGAFRAELEHLRPDIRILDASGGGGHNPGTSREVRAKLRNNPEISAVYSMGGGNRGVLGALADYGHKPKVFIAHDLDEDNLELLREKRLTLVLHHDLRSDMRRAFRHVLAFHGIGAAPGGTLSDIQIVTPVNIPSAFAFD